MEKKKLKVIISGGGTGGHIFPAISIANALREINPETEILFVGAEGKMEMEKIPAAGYEILGLPIAGLHRRITLKNLAFPFKLLNSMRLAKKIIKNYKPDVVVGVGGYASGPILKVAQRRNIPTLIQEQNSYAGITNRLLAKKANAICVAYENMDKYFPKENIILTGNPVRKGLLDIESKTDKARDFFNIPKENKVILVIGGSLGARTINESIFASINKIGESDNITLLWQTGKLYFDSIKNRLASTNFENIKVFDFIHQMDLAYSAANIIVSRAGACSISELCIVGKPTILIPSPNVAEDHQTSNAKALVNNNAAMMVTDKDAPNSLVSTMINLTNDEEKGKILANSIKKMALPNAAHDIAQKVLTIAETKKL